MKVLLIKDVYNLGRAGDVKKVADGYARNFLIPQRMAVMATQGSLKQIEKIQSAAAKQREMLNEEMAGLAEQLQGLEVRFTAKVGETGKLYGSITQQMIIDAVNEKLKVNIDRHQIESQPVREVGEHLVKIRLTFDLIPEVKVLVESEDAEKQAEKDKKKSRSSKSESAQAEQDAIEQPVAEQVSDESSEQPVSELVGEEVSALPDSELVNDEAPAQPISEYVSEELPAETAPPGDASTEDSETQED